MDKQYTLALLLTLALMGLVTACSDDGGQSTPTPEPAAEPEPEPEPEPEDAGCTEGFLGCDCISGTACFPGSDWVCIDGTCQEISCEVGSVDCACYANNSCDPDGAGNPVLCDSGICRPMGCEIGTTGCACTDEGGCEGELTCQVLSGDAVCAPDTCEVSTQGCPCGEESACNVGLTCVQNTCISPGCRPGADGCFCRPDLSCEGGLQCNGESVRCEPIPCDPGAFGCECDNGGCDAPDGVCNSDGLCEQVDCPNGAEGCSCLPDSTCSTSQNGENLDCVNGICQRDDCTAGDLGCLCVRGVQCVEGATCSPSGTCVLENCLPSSEFCRCAVGTCQSGLRCRNDNVCVDGTGFHNNPCGENGACEQGSRCSDNDICVRCQIGGEDCNCDEGDGCLNGLVCHTGRCLAEQNIPPSRPEPPFCRSYCTEDLVIDGERVVCEPNGLMDACLDGKTCIEGSCLEEGEEPPTCLIEADCPFWQTCIEGQCMSECDDNNRCPRGKQCVDHVCRIPCHSRERPCEEGLSCVTDDGANGFCFPNHETSGERNDPPEVFAVDKASIEFNNNTVTQTFVIRNQSQTFQSFTIRKRQHFVQFDNGDIDRARRASDGVIECDPDEQPNCACDEEDPTDCVCDGPGCFCSADRDCADDNFRCREGQCRPSTCGPGQCPMFWLRMGEREQGDPEASEQLTVTAEAGAGVAITLADADGSPGVRWQGVLEIVNDEMGVKTVDLLYNEVPEGQWSGEMVYLATFGTNGLEEWRVNQATRNNPDLQEDVGNALIQRWGAFRFGSISWDEMQAVLGATQSGSWRFPNVQEACEGIGEACYLYDIGLVGVEAYSSDLETIPIPSGAVELPFAMNLRLPNPDGDLMEGRIESSKALHYAGNPSVALRFNSTPDTCDLEAQGACVAFLDSFEADIAIGGRYLTVPEDSDCGDHRPGDDFGQVREPWLVPGFQQGTALDEETGRRYRYECRDTLLPFFSDDLGEQEAFAPFNQGLTISNPIPDARTRRRTLKLVDGALINGSELLIFFEEQFDSFLGDEDAFSAYGFMRLKRRATDLETTDNDGSGVADVFEGSEPEDARDDPEGVLDPTCSEDLLDQILGPNVAITGNNVTRLVTTLIDGVASGSNPEVLGPDSEEQVHYFCEETGLFDGGPRNITVLGISLAVPNNNACRLADDGICEDGGPRSEASVCRLGTDRSDCGPRFDADLDERIDCPAGSRVEFFTVDRGRLSQADIAQEGCQILGTCQETLARWKRSGAIVLQEEPRYRCTNPDEVFCDTNRLDLRDGKTFFAAGETEAVFVQLPSLIDEAFRYKTRFKNRQGQGIGFTPSICEPDSDLTPYCYDPSQIEEIEARIDCLLHVHQSFYEDLDDNNGPRDEAREKLDTFLDLNFSFAEENAAYLPQPIIHDGFERQLSQLLIMLGDESFTRAFASRFDLAGSNTASFEGTLFEDDGLDLSGAVGFEMFSLYQAAQYYQRVLDRFFSMSPVFWEATQFGVNPRNFVTPETVLRYFDRVIRASAQKARAWSEIAGRYQNLGRPDLARLVTGRAYTATYLESVVMGQIMQGILEGATLAENRPQIERAVEQAQLTYKIALTDMQNVHSEIEDNITIFGFEPDFIPFPALDAQDFRQSNAFEVLLFRTRNKMQFAREREETALNQGREFETNQAQFQSELTQIRNNFENQLADLCGTFVVGDEDNDPNNDRVLPAIKKYAHLNERAALLGDPCGMAGNGQLHVALAGLEDIGLDLQSLQIQQENILAEIEIERDRVSAQCGEILQAADFLYGKCDRADGVLGDNEEALDDINPFDPPEQSGCIQAQINEMQDDINGFRFGVNRLQSVQNMMGTALQLTKCGIFLDGSDCPAALVTTTQFLAGTAITEAGISVLEVGINTKEKEIADLERFKMKWQTENDCDLAKVESTARMRTILLRMRELELESLRIEHRGRLALSEVQRLRNQAKRLEAQQTESEALTINVQAAHNNPNVRIYKNDAIINAEIAFDDAIREAYKLTKVFEYYTSLSYANKNDLFLIRMISRGDKNLENYVNELENTFFEFEEFFGHPSNRVHIVSLKDNILAIPFNDTEGNPMSDTERSVLMRDRLTTPALLDRNGYITLPFSTNFDALSPLTRNHKILYVEADVYGNGNGDLLGRVYMRQKGTSVIHGVEGDKQFHRFDERVGVINTIFSGVRFFENTIYQNFTMRDRPFVNTQWELVINQRDEEVNQDINLNALTDVRLYVYYTDFTVF